MQGQRIWGAATDDGHGMEQHCLGWVRVNADRDVRSILSALERGAFYSSCGPEIYDFYVEDGVAVVECSPCAEITFRTGQYPGPRLHAADASLTRHTFRLPEGLRYVRVTMKDGQGRRAWSNPLFLQ